jgi:hypothetical protein
MECIICDSKMKFHFSKEFHEYNLEVVDYFICEKCGFVASKTHFEMSAAEWELLNNTWHEANNSRNDNPWNRSQRYFNQTVKLFLLRKNHFFVEGEWLDWGSGKGTISRLLMEQFDITLKNYDAFIPPLLNPADPNTLGKNHYALVINSAVFEHVRDRETLDRIEKNVSESGAFAIHTLVPDKVPKDPNWMYLLPVHCAFHTNSSMQILMDQWGYRCSVYNPNTKLWVLFKANSDSIRHKVDQLNSSLGHEYLIFKKGFVDYWK